MTKHIVHCRVCKEAFDAKEEDRDIEWVMPSRNWYYHKTCYTSWKECKDNKNEDDWILLIYDFIARDVKGEYSYMQCEAQRKKFVTARMTNKGIYYSLYWFYIVKKNRWNPDYGLGIIPHIYKDATNYWIRKESAKTGIVAQIERLAREKKETTPIEIKKKVRNRKKKVIKMPD